MLKRLPQSCGGRPLCLKEGRSSFKTRLGQGVTLLHGEDLGVVLVGHLVEDLVVSLGFLLLTLCLGLKVLFHVLIS